MNSYDPTTTLFVAISRTERFLALDYRQDPPLVLRSETHHRDRSHVWRPAARDFETFLLQRRW